MTDQPTQPTRPGLLGDAASLIVAALDTAMPVLHGCDPAGLSALIASHTTSGWTITPIREAIETTRLLYTVDEAAKWLKVSRSTLYRDMDVERLDYVKIGRSRRIPHEALLAYLDQEREQVGARRVYTDTQILTNLRSCAAALGQSPSGPAYDKWVAQNGGPVARTVIERFVTWNDALDKADIRAADNAHYDAQQKGAT